MSVHLLLITHDEIGASLLKAVQNTFGQLPLTTEVIAIKRQNDPQKIITKIKKFIENWGATSGILLLTDIFGSTPSNIAENLHQLPNTRLVTGLNLPMLIRVMNYPNLDLGSLALKAVTGGREGIIECAAEEE